MNRRKKPNIIFVFADQWRAQATGESYNDDPNIITPNLDHLASESLVFCNAISGNPVCSPYRASLLTGKFPIEHGVFLNDVRLNPEINSIAKIYKKNGYKTAYIGKWHLDGGVTRSSFIPKERRQGFDYWKVLECTHDYNHSEYFNNYDEKEIWNGYDAKAQTRDAMDYITNNSKEFIQNDQPFLLFISWGPPHAPYNTAPEKFKMLYRKKNIILRPNVKFRHRRRHRKELKGYYAHISALDNCIGLLQNSIFENNIEKDTILVFTSDHGDMLGSQGQRKKQRPWAESINVPFILKYPRVFGKKHKHVNFLIDAPDILPTLLGLSELEIPNTLSGVDYSNRLIKGEFEANNSKIIECITPFSQFSRKLGGREYRGIRNERYTYVRDLNGAWLFYDNKLDPYQLKNLANNKKYLKIQKKLDVELEKLLVERGDQFKSADYYLNKWNYQVNKKDGAIPYKN